MYSEGYCWTDWNFVLIAKYPRFTRTVKSLAPVVNGIGGGFNYWSLNFGRPSIIYNDDESVSNDPGGTTGEETIYSRLWKPYINGLFKANNKVLAVYVLLDISDISGNLFQQVCFNKQYAVGVSKAYEFNPPGKAPCKS